MTFKTTCPKCNAETEVSGSLIGRFVTCENCRCLYYVVVPPLKKDEPEEFVTVPAVSSAHPSTPHAERASLKQTLDSRYARMMTLLVANLALGAAVLAIELIRLFK